MTIRCSTSALIAMLAALGGCGDDSPVADGGPLDGASDASASDADRDGGLGIAPPEIPWLADGAPALMLAPCPEGWREVTVDGVSECDPYPAAGPAACDPGQAHFPGEPGCRAIGEACPAGDYAAALPTEGSVVYVNAAAAAGGDGSLAAPYAELSEISWSSLPAGTTVALAKGTHAGTLQVKEGVRVVGACVRDTRVTGGTGAERDVVTVLEGSGAAVVQGLTIGASPKRGVVARGGRAITLEGVLLEQTHDVAILALDPGTVVTLRDVVVRDTQPRSSDEAFGRGINVDGAAELAATRLLVTRNRDVGIFVGGPGTAVSLTDVVVQGTQPQASDGLGGRGIGMVAGAELSATRLSVTANHELGIAVDGAGAVLTLTDAIIRGTAPGSSDALGNRGLNVQTGAALDATRLLVASNRAHGIFVSGDGCIATLTDVVVRDTQPQTSDDSLGRGLNVQDGAELTATRLLVSGNRNVGVFVNGEGSTVTLTDVAVRDTQPRSSDETQGRGVNVQRGGELTATRLLVAESHQIGVFASGDLATVTVTDTVVRGTRPQASDATGGRGISVEEVARLEAERLVVEDSFEFGIISVNGSSVVASDVAVARVAQAACASSSCPEAVHGHGVAAVAAALRLTRFHVRDAATCGVFLAPLPGATTPVAVDLETGTIRGTEIGACLQVDGYDIGRLQNAVRYLDNGTNLDSTALPVPEAVDPIAD